MGLIRGLLVGAGNKSTAGSSDLLSRTIKSLFDANCIRRCAHETYVSTFKVFEKSWLMGYCGVVTVTELDVGPRVLLTTGATE